MKQAAQLQTKMQALQAELDAIAVVSSLVAAGEPRDDEERAVWLDEGGRAVESARADGLFEELGTRAPETLGEGDDGTASGHEDAEDESTTAHPLEGDLVLGAEANTPNPPNPPNPPDAPSTGAAAPLSVDARFLAVERLLEQGKRADSRHLLHEIARSPVGASDRARAWMLIADSYVAERDYLDAAEAYRRAAHAGGRSLSGQNALYALARLRERSLSDTSGAIAAYHQYLSVAPNGANASLVRRALCRLGEREHCE